MTILNRAKHLYSEEYFISKSIEFKDNKMYLKLDNGDWAECDESTRSINFSDMKDSDGVEIFASLSEDGKGGTEVRVELSHMHGSAVAVVKRGCMLFMWMNSGDDDYSMLDGDNMYAKVTGIQK